MKSAFHLCLYLFLCLTFCLPSALSQPLFLLRGSEKFPVKELPDGGKSVDIGGRTYFLVAKEDLAALTQESESLRALNARNDSLLAGQSRLLERYAHYEIAADTLVTRQESQIEQSEKIAKTFDEIYRDLKRMAGLSPWSVTAGIGVRSPDASAKLMGSVGLGYRHWMAEYQFAKNYTGVVVGFRVSL
jgi:hypothetical protein